MKSIMMAALLLGSVATAGAAGINVKRLSPNLYVPDVGPCVAFWERLGFVKTMEVPEGKALAFAKMNKGDFEVMYGSYASLAKEAAGMRKLLNSPAFLFV